MAQEKKIRFHHHLFGQRPAHHGVRVMKADGSIHHIRHRPIRFFLKKWLGLGILLLAPSVFGQVAISTFPIRNLPTQDVNIKKIAGNLISTTASGLPVGLPVVGATTPSLGISSVTCISGSSTQALPGRPSTPRYMDCYALSTNTDSLFVNVGAAALITSPDEVAPKGNWFPPELVKSTESVNCIAASGSQVFRCREY